MPRPPSFFVEHKQRLLELLIEAFESDLPPLEEALSRRTSGRSRRHA